MRAAFFRRHGPPDVLEVGDLPDPGLGPGEVLVRVRAAGVNHLDVWLRRGLPTLRVPLPHIGGSDVCGVIESVGAGVAGLDPGTRVVVNPGVSCGRCEACLSGDDPWCARFSLVGEQRWGGHAERLVVPLANVVAAPEGPDDATLAAVPVVYLTAWSMLVDRAKIGPRDTVLVWAAGSGVGMAGTQIAKLHRARVIAVGSTEDKLARARQNGADEALLAPAPDDADAAKRFLAAVKRATDGRGADVVFEHTGAATFPLSIRAAARGGRIVTCGATTGHDATVDLRHVFWRHLSIHGVTMAPKGRLHGILALVAQGRLRPVVDRVEPLEAIAELHRTLEARGAFGKLVLRVS